MYATRARACLGVPMRALVCPLRLSAVCHERAGVRSVATHPHAWHARTHPSTRPLKSIESKARSRARRTGSELDTRCVVRGKTALRASCADGNRPGPHGLKGVLATQAHGHGRAIDLTYDTPATPPSP
eukprot:CAMPEP_0181199798 /NCGR_PEP_ID=MMETSP1096-20121128/17380_1 /TAXON_ID=156174 ORGANISM="Chrysochromulina ericina, Strain CCMP281" /NCGR_SAMPLE_ID=MMETSP1096 /ASSEMBLY_ACC=CAM_ASM_000453 /LENGTH=127 /DNA_ID=CAMNT_0023290027 /DNA_START=551 /DNA_END=930 /DNA_ORIENTATION=-